MSMHISMNITEFLSTEYVVQIHLLLIHEYKNTISICFMPKKLNVIFEYLQSQTLTFDDYSTT